MDHEPLIILYGPTGVGKTEIALALSDHKASAILNADVGQLYTPLSIGTAKPDWQNNPTPHYLFDILDEPIDFSVKQYRKAVSDLLPLIYHQNRVPLLVGGSGFYIQALFFPPHEHPTKLLPRMHTDNLWHTLQTIDPQRAREIHPHDTYRIQRALDIWATTGKNPSSFRPIYRPIQKKYHMVWLHRTTTDLHNRINQRTAQMIEQGWIDEVARLLETPWITFLQRKKIIGYDDIISFLLYKKPSTTCELIEQIAQKTRNYAKRQKTFWHRLKKMIHMASHGNKVISEFNATDTPFETIVSALLSVT